jgi:hypothetical protein
MAATYRKHSGIGTAPVGDSNDEFFVGWEKPGVPAVLGQPAGSSNGTYRTAAGHIKRQRARFHDSAFWPLHDQHDRAPG